MTIKKMMMGAGAVDEPQVIAPSSNDWDYTFAQNEWPVAGNTLGDHTIGGYIDNIGGDSALGSLITFDGDFEVEFTFTGIQHSAFGVHALTDDDHRATEQYLGAKAMTNSFSWIEAGTNPKDFFIGSTAQSDTHTFATGSVVKIERVSGTITIYDDDVSVHVFGTTYSGAMRVWFGAGGAPFTSDLDNILFTDTEKVQRDGFFNETDTGGVFTSGASRVADRDNCGNTWRATRTGNITGAKVSVHSVATSGDYWIEIWSDDGTNPVAQVGGDSDTLTISSSGVKEYTFATPVPIVKGTTYWFVIANTTTGEVQWDTVSNASFPGGGRFDRDATITSLGDIVAYDLMFEVVVDTSAGEPTPDHDTLLLIHSDTSDGSTTFADSSQFGRTITVAGNAQHDTAQKKFGASSILFDGTGDYLTVPDHTDFDFGLGNWTVDFWYRSADSNLNSLVCLGDWDCANGPVVIFQSSDGDLATAYNLSTGVISNEGAGSTAIDTGSWVHIAVSRIGPTQIKAWINGTEDTAQAETIGATATMTNLTTTLSIGRMPSRTAYDLTGHIEEVRVSRVARWDANFTPPTSPYP